MAILFIWLWLRAEHARALTALLFDSTAEMLTRREEEMAELEGLAGEILSAEMNPFGAAILRLEPRWWTNDENGQKQRVAYLRAQIRGIERTRAQLYGELHDIRDAQ